MSRRAFWILLVAFAVTSATSAIADAQFVIKVNDDVNFKLGILAQFQADTIEDPQSDANTSNLFIRRVRLMFGGEVAKKISFFVETDNPNLGKTLPPGGKTLQPSTIVSTIIQDAYGEFKASNAFALDAGLMFVPFSRNALQSAATLLPIDYGAYTFTQSVPTESLSGRDTGFQAKGYFVADHLEYRIGAFQGDRDPRSHNPFRYVGRLQYNFLDPETGFFYTGSYTGQKKVVAVGAAFDVQKQYHGFDVDAFADLPTGVGRVTSQFDYNFFNGDITFPTLPKQHDFLFEFGYLIPRAQLTPVLQFSNRAVVGGLPGDESHWSIGLNYWWAGHNANVKGAYSRINPAGATGLNEFTVQLQLFYF